METALPQLPKEEAWTWTLRSMSLPPPSWESVSKGMRGNDKYTSQKETAPGEDVLVLHLSKRKLRISCLKVISVLLPLLKHIMCLRLLTHLWEDTGRFFHYLGPSPPVPIGTEWNRSQTRPLGKTQMHTSKIIEDEHL